MDRIDLPQTPTSGTGREVLEEAMAALGLDGLWHLPALEARLDGRADDAA
ncbi:MAG: hypothetical protein AAFR17_06065 [Pseudomonadota bacterium]